VNWRIPAAVALLVFLAWVGFEIGHAGSDIKVARVAADNKLFKGSIHGKRIDRRSWSLDFDTVTMSPDGQNATIAHVRDGRIHRINKPDVLMRADTVTVNTLSNDLAIAGPVTFTVQEGAGRTRTFQTTGARYNGGTQLLDLNHRATITEGSARIVVAKATVNFRTGEVLLGPIEGTKS
jgi:hypothetical protein